MNEENTEKQIEKLNNEDRLDNIEEWQLQMSQFFELQQKLCFELLVKIDAIETIIKEKGIITASELQSEYDKIAANFQSAFERAAKETSNI